LQEAEEALLLYLRSPVSAKEKRAEGNEGVKGEPRPGSKSIGVRGLEPKSGLMICARASLAVGIITSIAISQDIRWSVQGERKKTSKTAKGAVSRIMIASLHMRYVRIRGRGVAGDDAEDLDEIRIANAHMHFRTAKRDLHKGSAAYIEDHPYLFQAFRLVMDAGGHDSPHMEDLNDKWYIPYSILYIMCYIL